MKVVVVRDDRWKDVTAVELILYVHPITKSVAISRIFQLRAGFSDIGK